MNEIVVCIYLLYKKVPQKSPKYKIELIPKGLVLNFTFTSAQKIKYFLNCLHFCAKFLFNLKTSLLVKIITTPSNKKCPSVRHGNDTLLSLLLQTTYNLRRQLLGQWLAFIRIQFTWAYLLVIVALSLLKCNVCPLPFHAASSRITIMNVIVIIR